MRINNDTFHSLEFLKLTTFQSRSSQTLNAVAEPPAVKTCRRESEIPTSRRTVAQRIIMVLHL